MVADVRLEKHFVIEREEHLTTLHLIGEAFNIFGRRVSLYAWNCETLRAGTTVLYG